MSAFNLIPQGGGDHFTTRRCAGKWIASKLMKDAIRLLATAKQYEVPLQDLHIDLSNMPAILKSRFVISDVKHAG